MRWLVRLLTCRCGVRTEPARPRYGYVQDFANPDGSKRGPKGRRLCLVCGVEVTPPKRSYCSAECVQRWLIRTRSGSARRAVRQRDKGICVACGIDCVALKKMLIHAWREYGRTFTMALKTRLGIRKHPLGKSYWEADHIVPVAEGGGSCDLDGFRTLCLWCHRLETTALMRRLKTHRAS